MASRFRPICVDSRLPLRQKISQWQNWIDVIGISALLYLELWAKWVASGRSGRSGAYPISNRFTRWPRIDDGNIRSKGARNTAPIIFMTRKPFQWPPAVVTRLPAHCRVVA